VLLPENRGHLVVGMLSLGLPVLLLWRCAAQPEPPPAAAAAVARPSATPPTPPLTAAPATTQQATARVPASGASEDSALAPASGATPSPVASLAAPSPSASSSTAAGIIAAVARRDPRDLALLSRIERELKRDPPAAVHSLIRMRESGASRAQLLAEADKQLGSDVALRVIVRRWIEETAPGAAAPPKTLGPTPGGGHDPLIKPIEPTKSP
jgi:hypothetical protein